MINLDESNDYAAFGSMLHNNGKRLTAEQIQKRKFLYLEGLIRFLQLYAQNEIGEVEVDIEKAALWVNSPAFENVDVYKLTSIASVYEALTRDLTERNIPLYRLLKLSDYQLAILEQDHYDALQSDFKKDCEKYPCLKCLWYSNEVTSLGTLSKCSCPKEDIERRASTLRRGFHNIALKSSRNCKYLTEADTIQDFLNKYSKRIPEYKQRQIISQLNNAKDKWTQKIKNLDNSYIPVSIPENLKVCLNDKTDVMEDLARVFGNKKGKDEMRNNLRFAIFLRYVIEFVEVYAQSEMGSDYEADITKIARFISQKGLGLHNLCSEKDILDYLEEQAAANENYIRKFIKKKAV